MSNIKPTYEVKYIEHRLGIQLMARYKPKNMEEIVVAIHDSVATDKDELITKHEPEIIKEINRLIEIE